MPFHRRTESGHGAPFGLFGFQAQRTAEKQLAQQFLKLVRISSVLGRP